MADQNIDETKSLAARRAARPFIGPAGTQAPPRPPILRPAAAQPRPPRAAFASPGGRPALGAVGGAARSAQPLAETTPAAAMRSTPIATPEWLEDDTPSRETSAPEGSDWPAAEIEAAPLVPDMVSTPEVAAAEPVGSWSADPESDVAPAIEAGAAAPLWPDAPAIDVPAIDARRVETQPSGAAPTPEAAVDRGVTMDASDGAAWPDSLVAEYAPYVVPPSTPFLPPSDLDYHPPLEPAAAAASGPELNVPEPGTRETLVAGEAGLEPPEVVEAPASLGLAAVEPVAPALPVSYSVELASGAAAPDPAPGWAGGAWSDAAPLTPSGAPEAETSCAKVADAAAADSRALAAAMLERLAVRVRAGEIDLSSIAPEATDAAMLASVLAALLGGTSSR